jgi:polyisoprenoid-binding protein YceI
MFKNLILIFTISFLIVGCNNQPVQTDTSETLTPGETIPSLPTNTLGANETGYPAPDFSEPDNPETPASGANNDAYPAPPGGQSLNPTSPPVTSGDAGYPAGGSFVEAFQIVPGESEVSYEVTLILLDENNRADIVIGSTNDLTGEILVNRTNPQSSIVRFVNVETNRLDSGDGELDTTINQEFLESSTFPSVSFIPFEIQGLQPTYQEGQPLTLQISGDLTIRQVTKPVTFEAIIQLQGNSLTGEATTSISMGDFEIGPVSSDGILEFDDEVILKIEFVARP